MEAPPADAVGAEGSSEAPAPSKPAPPKVAYHRDVRCRRGAGCTCGEGPVIVGRMYRVGDVCVCEGAACEEEKAHGPVEPAKAYFGPPLEGLDLRGWKAADIPGLRGADGTLDLVDAILCGVDLHCAELRGAKLVEAQLQGAVLYEAQLQGADFRWAQLQGANLSGAQLQGADLRGARLQGAWLRGAQLQGAVLRWADLRGADLNWAQLQGANLSNTDLSVLPKGFLLPKQGLAGETEATQEDRATVLTNTNLSVLPKGSEYNAGRADVEVSDDGEVKVSDAARPTNLTDAKASGAYFTGADLIGANFTGTTIDHATLKDATFPPLKPPERPASRALSGAWRAKALLGSVGRAVVAAADDDNDNDDSDGESEEEESPDGVKAKMEEALDACMSKLATAAQVFMRTVDGMVGKVEALLKGSLLESCKGTGRNSSASVLDVNSILTELLCKKLETANDKQAAIFETLFMHVVSPLFERHLPKVLEDARSELPKPTDEAGTAGHQLLEQLLEAFKERALGAGKDAFLKRLSPIVSEAVGAGYANPHPALA